MQIIKSRIRIALEKMAWLMPALGLTGCSLSPAIPVIGAYYPGWQFCLIIGVILTLISRRIILNRYPSLALASVIYTALFALYSMLVWLVFF